jgi:aquaporin NIP
VTRSLRLRCAGEAVGTALLVGIGTGSIVFLTKSGGDPAGALPAAWFVAVTLPVFLFARLSGAHLNPAVTLALVVGGDFPRRDGGGYILAQTAGAFAGSSGVLAILGDAGRLGSTVPVSSELPLAFVAEAGFTALLTLSVFALVRRGFGVRSWRLIFPGTVVGWATYVIGPLTGCSLNPARSLAPAILSGTFQGLWVYFVAVPLGALASVPVAAWLLHPER